MYSVGTSLLGARARGTKAAGWCHYSQQHCRFKQLFSWIQKPLPCWYLGLLLQQLEMMPSTSITSPFQHDNGNKVNCDGLNSIQIYHQFLYRDGWAGQLGMWQLECSPKAYHFMPYHNHSSCTDSRPWYMWGGEQRVFAAWDVVIRPSWSATRLTRRLRQAIWQEGWNEIVTISHKRIAIRQLQ